MDEVDSVLIFVSVIMATVGVIVPVLIPMQIGAILSGGLGFSIKLIRRMLYKKLKKHDEIKMVANTKFNTVKELVSKALNDGSISEIDVKLILTELEKYYNLKKEIKEGAVKEIKVGLSDEEQNKLIEEGKRIAKEDFLKNGRRLIL